MKCLVVDDSGITRRILVNSLKTIGFGEILEATNGKQALELCTADVDIVLTDWNMPGMAGVDLVRSLRTNPSLRDIPVLLVTARTAREDVIEAASAGVNGYVIKPFTPDVLAQKIEETLQRARSSAGDEGAGAAGTGTEG
jgi:two-component system chemotaxis response regulator CheY